MRAPLQDRFPGLSSFLYTEFDAQHRRYQELLDEDQLLRHAEYDKPIS